MTIYLAYASNLHLEQMARRCPRAVPLGRFKLKDWRLVFRSVADVIQEPGAVCWGGAWRITAECERALDRYEGVDWRDPTGPGGMYRKVYLPIKETSQGEKELLLYVMNSTGIAPPSAYYYNVIRQGYRDFDMPDRAWRALRKALRDSYDDKNPSHIERQRRRRDGRPALAAYPGPRPADIAATATDKHAA